MADRRTELEALAGMSHKKRDFLVGNGMVVVGYILIDPENSKEATIRMGNVQWKAP